MAAGRVREYAPVQEARLLETAFCIDRIGNDALEEPNQSMARRQHDDDTQEVEGRVEKRPA